MFSKRARKKRIRQAHDLACNRIQRREYDERDPIKSFNVTYEGIRTQNPICYPPSFSFLRGGHQARHDMGQARFVSLVLDLVVRVQETLNCVCGVGFMLMMAI